MRVYVGNLSKEVTDAQLNDLAMPYGKPAAANVARELKGGASKGFGFLDYEKEDEAKAAIAGLHGKNVNGQALKVSEANRTRKSPPLGV